MLYVIATPIGNLQDITLRAIAILQQVDLIVAEDTRQARKLLQHLKIQKPLLTLHAHNEQQQAELLLEKLQAQQNIGLISDAGTPLISDPGLPLVRLAQNHNIKVIPIPGPCALISALSVAGIATTRFTFEGFLPAKISARQKCLNNLLLETRTMIFYEAPHRIIDCLEDMNKIFAGDRYAVIARELTKIYETIKTGTLTELIKFVTNDPKQQLGEIVLIVSGASLHEDLADPALTEAQRILTILRQELPLTKAASLTAKITGIAKQVVYALGVKLSKG